MEIFHQYFNKDVTIATQDEGILDMFVPACIITEYVWNNAPIEESNILRSIPAIERKLSFN